MYFLDDRVFKVALDPTIVTDSTQRYNIPICKYFYVIQVGCYNGGQIYGGISVIALKSYSQVFYIPIYREVNSTSQLIGTVYAFINVDTETRFVTYKPNPYNDSYTLAARILYN